MALCLHIPCLHGDSYAQNNANAIAVTERLPTMNSQNELIIGMASKQAIAQASPDRHSAVRRAAEALSRRTIDQVTVELLNEALARLCVLCYERDESGQLCNV